MTSGVPFLLEANPTRVALVYWAKTCSLGVRDWSEHAKPTCCLEVIRSDRWPTLIVLEEERGSKTTTTTTYGYSGREKLFESAMAEGEALLVWTLLQLQPNS